MAYDLHLADRIRRVVDKKKVAYIEKQMMGGWCLLINDKMCVGIVKNDLMVRIDPELDKVVSKKKGCRPMDFTGRVMKGYYFISPEAVDLEKDLEYWVQLCLDFNPKAKSSKKNKK